jgi:integrase
VGLTVARYLLHTWLPRKSVSLRPSTWDGYRRNIEIHVIPRIGSIPLLRLRGDHIDSLYSELLADGRVDGKGGLDPKTVLEIHVILRRAFHDACRQGLVVRNVVVDAEPPKRRRPPSDVRAWSSTQVLTFLDTARSDRLFPALWLAANTGMRRSELLGLRWEDVDLAAGHLSISRSLVSVAYELHESRGKTRYAKRRVDLDPQTVRVIAAWHERLEAGLGRRLDEDDYVFCSQSGAPTHPDRFSQVFNKLVARAGVSRRRLHDLRHTHATLLLKAGIPVKVVSERLGHATSDFTLATYRHVLPGMQAEAARTFASLLSPTVSTNVNPIEEPVEVSDRDKALARSGA